MPEPKTGELRPGKAILLTPGTRLGYKVVASIGYADDWAAYYGFTRWTDAFCAAHGDKLRQDVAEGLFPDIVAAGLRYRR